MLVRIALAGDTMLGRGVAALLRRNAPESLVAPDIAAVMRDADLCVLNLECCISERGTPWPDPSKPFFFRAPPAAIDVLHHLGVDCVTLANNHALDFGEEALEDTLALLDGAGIARVGAGRTVREARRPVVLDSEGATLTVIALTDHPADYAAGPDRPGVAHADLWHHEVPAWVTDTIAAAATDAVLVTPHWGPNMTSTPVPHVIRSAATLVGAGATVVAGHSAHVFHGVRWPVIYDLGDFLDDYAVDPIRRNDLGLLFLADIEDGGLASIEAIPLALEYGFTRPAVGEERTWIVDRFRRACEPFGTDLQQQDGRLVVGPSG